MSTLLALNGTLPDAARVVELCSQAQTVVAADGAAIAMLAAGGRVDVVIGDLDSIGSHRQEIEAAGATIVEEASQESGDFAKALRWLGENGASDVTIIGFDGGMLDHTLNNASVLAGCARTMSVRVLSGDAVAYRVVDALTLATRPGERVSLIPLPNARVSTTGLEWELADETLAIGVREGASNRATGSSARITVSDGVLLVAHFPGGTR